MILIFWTHQTVSLMGTDTLSREVTLSKLFCFPSEKGSALKGKNLLLMGANPFFLE